MTSTSRYLLVCLLLLYLVVLSFATPKPPAGRSSAFLPSSPFSSRLPISYQQQQSYERRILQSVATAADDGRGATEGMKLCKNCKKYYDPAINTDRSCRYHTKAFTGDTKRKGDWSANVDRFENERMWWCCGDTDVNSPGCKYDRHKSYDDE